MTVNFSYNDVLEHSDMNNILLSIKGNGIHSGMQVTEKSTPDMGVTVETGSCFISGSAYREDSSVNLVITAADVTNARIDIIVFSASGNNPTVVTGTPAAIPIPPDIPANNILLAFVDVSANITSIVNSFITDKRISVYTAPPVKIYASDASINENLTEYSTASTTFVNLSNLGFIKAGLLNNSSTLRLKFDMRISDVSSNAKGQIYKNNVAVGTEQDTSSNSYITFSEDISGWSSTDKINLYVRTTDSSHNAYINDFKSFGSLNPSW